MQTRKFSGKSSNILEKKSFSQREARKRAAYRTVRKLITRRKLAAPGTLNCFVCGGQARVYHHISYSLPAEVFPLCVGCHRKWHYANGEVD